MAQQICFRVGTGSRKQIIPQTRFVYRIGFGILIVIRHCLGDGGLKAGAFLDDFFHRNSGVANGLPPTRTTQMGLILPFQQMQQQVTNIAFQSTPFTFTHILQFLCQMLYNEFIEAPGAE